MAFTLQRAPCNSFVIAFTTLPLMPTTRNRTKFAGKHRPTQGVGKAVKNLQSPLQHAPMTVGQPSQARTLRQAPAVTQHRASASDRPGRVAPDSFVLLLALALLRKKCTSRRTPGSSVEEATENPGTSRAWACLPSAMFPSSDASAKLAKISGNWRDTSLLSLAILASLEDWQLRPME